MFLVKILHAIQKIFVFECFFFYFYKCDSHKKFLHIQGSPGRYTSYKSTK